ncbi:MAG: DUF3134 domain-containing protein [Nostoc sp.]|uniref:DUF3134 domain-containing protein n=1 Tax=unclassified Nostoc TaxID=2593658 RepID=UPI000DEC5A51|nr:DUF3134 domain-containing protein [Nostoc sp. ATCC 53789]QHG17773.1 DUF3134 domain-containing protein [Nostoc sp. ATCC 53789]RCJ26272.1 hypothetical protein A6V25_03060 [Nostoc sp. ATCC 53789]
MLNSPLREEPRNQRAHVIPLKPESSMLDWLENKGRIITRDVQDPDFQDGEEEIDSLMGVEDGIGYDLDDDDDIGIAED